MQIVNHIIIKDGEARIIGKEHVKVEMVARMVVDGDYSIEQAMTHYNLTAAEAYAALAYYYDNRDELDAAYERSLSEIHENAMTLDKFKAKLTAKNSKR